MVDYTSTEVVMTTPAEFGTMTEFNTTIFTTMITEMVGFTDHASAETSTTHKHLATAGATVSTTEYITFGNVSNDKEFVFDSLPQRAFIASLILLASFVGIIGNSLVILSVFASRKLQTVTNVYVVNLAVADLLVSLALPWNAVALIVIEGWPLPPHLCSAVAGILFVSVGCSVYTLASIALNRWIVITQSRKLSQRVFHMKVLCIWIALLWLVPFIGTIIPPLVGFGMLGYNKKYGTCSNVSEAPKSDEYDMLSAMVIYPIPLVIIVVFYVKTFLHVRKHSVKLNEYQAKKRHGTDSPNSMNHSEDFASEASHQVSFQMDDTVVSSVSFNNSEKIKSADSNTQQPDTMINPKDPHQTTQTSNSRTDSVRQVIKKRLSKKLRNITIRPHLSHRELVITKNMFYIVVVFFICLSPFTFCLLIDSSDPALPYAAAMVFFNSCLNPIVYAIKHPYFKQVFGLIIKCKLRDIPQPSGSLKAVLRALYREEETYV